MKLTLSRDDNGNKTVLVKFGKSRAFAIQTCGTLFETHRMSKKDFDDEIAESEVSVYINEYGSKKQKLLLEKQK